MLLAFTSYFNSELGKISTMVVAEEAIGPNGGTEETQDIKEPTFSLVHSIPSFVKISTYEVIAVA